MLKIHEDARHRTITNAEIGSLYRKLPKQFHGFLLKVRYKKDDEDLFNEHLNIEIDQNSFLTELVELRDGKKEHIYFTDGMCDIDFFLKEKELAVFYSPNDGIYIHLYFSKDSLKKLMQWVDLELKDEK
jgi:hypothetical protein